MKYFALLAAVGSFLPIPASAVDAIIGIEGGVAQTDLAFESPFAPDDTFSDDEDQVAGIYGGLIISRHFSVEFAYTDLGSASFTYVQVMPPLPPPGPATSTRHESRITYESEFGSLSLLGRYDFTPRLAVDGRLGVATHRYEWNLTGTVNGQPVPVRGESQGSDSVNAAVLGVGLEWSLHQHWKARAQVYRHLVDEVQDSIMRGDLTGITVGLHYRF